MRVPALLIPLQRERESSARPARALFGKALNPMPERFLISSDSHSVSHRNKLKLCPNPPPKKPSGMQFTRRREIKATTNLHPLRGKSITVTIPIVMLHLQWMHVNLNHFSVEVRFGSYALGLKTIWYLFFCGPKRYYIVAFSKVHKPHYGGWCKTKKTYKKSYIYLTNTHLYDAVSPMSVYGCCSTTIRPAGGAIVLGMIFENMVVYQQPVQTAG